MVYLFCQNSLVLPDDVSGEDAAGGVAEARADAAFGALPYWRGGALLPEDRPLPSGWRLFPLRQMPELFGLFHLLQWREQSKFCGSCGAPNEDDTAETARKCPRCGRVEFPRISPAVITLVTDEKGRALLAHNNKFKEGVYSLIAGFTEAGENLESTVAREIREETGVEVRDVRFAGSQSWPFPNSLMVGFTARHASGEPRPDGVEIADVRWFTREEILQKSVEIPSHGSISRYIIDKWLERSPF